MCNGHRREAMFRHKCLCFFFVKNVHQWVKNVHKIFLFFLVKNVHQWAINVHELFFWMSINKPLAGLGWRVRLLGFSIKYHAEKKLRILNSLSVRIRSIYTKRPHSSTNELCGRLVLLITYYFLLITSYLLLLTYYFLLITSFLFLQISCLKSAIFFLHDIW